MFDNYLHAKIIFTPMLCLEILHRYSRFVILGSMGMRGHTYQEQKHQLVGNSDVDLQTKINFKESCNLIGQENFWQ